MPQRGGRPCQPLVSGCHARTLPWSTLRAGNFDFNMRPLNPDDSPLPISNLHNSSEAI
jgi:hypothetical protein